MRRNGSLINLNPSASIQSHASKKSSIDFVRRSGEEEWFQVAEVCFYYILICDNGSKIIQAENWKLLKKQKRLNCIWELKYDEGGLAISWVFLYPPSYEN